MRVLCTSMLSVCLSAGFRQFGTDIKVVAARLHYKDTRLTLKLLYGEPGDLKTRAPHEWQNCFEVNDLIVPPGYFLSASASTGQLSDVHEVLSIEVRGDVNGNAAQVPDDIVAGWHLDQHKSVHIDAETVEDALRTDENGNHVHQHVENTEPAPGTDHGNAAPVPGADGNAGGEGTQGKGEQPAPDWVPSRDQIRQAAEAALAAAKPPVPPTGSQQIEGTCVAGGCVSHKGGQL